MSQAQLQKRIAGGEDQTTVFLRSAKDADRVGRAICALLNTEGGSIFCGVDDAGEIVGVGGAGAEVARQLETDLKERISPLALFMISCVELEGKGLVVVEVPQGKDGPYVMDGGIWLREGGRTRAADVAMIRRLLKVQAEAPIRWERRVSPSMTDEDLDIDEVRAAVRDAEGKRFSFIDPTDNHQVLKQLGAYDGTNFTQGGDVLFGRMPSQRHPQCRAQLVVFKGDKSSDEFSDNRWFEGPLVRVCRDMIAAVNAANPIRSDFRADTTRREDRADYDANALREGIVNAFVHRDYSAYSGGLRVSIYPSRIEIWNSGRLPDGLTASALRGQHDSIPTNPDIAHVFYLREMMEQVGRGTELIIRRSKELGAPAPTWKDAATGVTLVIYSSNQTQKAELALNARQSALLGELQANETITLKDYHARFASEVSDRQARRDLRELETSGLLRQQGRGASTAYLKLP